MIKRVAGLGTIAFWVTVTCVRLITSIPDDIPEMILLKDYAIVKPTEKATVEPDIVETLLEKALEPGCTEEDFGLLVLECMREAGVKEVDAIHAVAQVIWNRMKSEDYPNTVKGVIYQENQFALHDNGEPNWKCYQAVENMLASPEAFPTDMYWFNSEHYPNYGYPYTVIDGMYFSTETDYHTGEEE